MATISVIIPLYNKALHIERALRSVLAQSFQDFEIVVVNDGSIDGSAAVVEGISDSRIRLIHQANAGVSVARNRGVAESRYELVAFLDADDEWLPEFLESVAVAVQRDPEVGVVFTNLRLSSVEKPWLPLCRGGRLEDYFVFFVACRGHGMSSSSVLIKKDVLQRVGGFPLHQTHGEDIDTWARLAWEVPIAYVPEVLVVYHVTGGLRAMDAGRGQIATSLDRCAQACRDRMRQNKVPPRFCRSTLSYAHMLYSMCAREQKDAGDTGKAFKTLAKSLSLVTTVQDLRIITSAFLRTACPSWCLKVSRQLW